MKTFTFRIGQLLIAATFICSCNTKLISIHGYNNDYDKLSESGKSRIHTLTSFRILENAEVYVVDPVSLKEEIARHPKSLVVLYSTNCNSSSCQTISSYEKFASNNGYHLFLTMISYEGVEQAIAQNPTCPIFVVDNDYYNEKRRFIYERYFLNDLIDYPTHTKYKDIPDEMENARLFFYENGKLVNVSKEIP